MFSRLCKHHLKVTTGDFFFRFKGGKSLETVATAASSRYSVEKKVSSQVSTLKNFFPLVFPLSDTIS
jgi:hypothetical protein